ncbi:MAG TPA: hypothetical protein VGQ24_04405 [Gemmatimonadales bacterium]|jgi:hypothetical protein|nr:hypothetical protein [Gemmatimonadales bacterium]
MRNLEHPAVRRIARIAAALGDMLSDVVFIGGAIAPLLHSDSPFGEPRPTKDTDAVVASTRYSDVEVLHERLRRRGFRHDPADREHMHRWLSPENDILDLVPAGSHPGGSGQIWDRIALETSAEVDLGIGGKVRYAGAPAFLALKFAAFADRGAEDPFGSHDLEDIFALLAARPSTIAEVRESTAEVREFLVRAATTLTSRTEFEDLLAAHLNNAQDPGLVCERVRLRLQELKTVRVVRPENDDSGA